MNRATLYLTRKDINRNPVGPLVVDVRFVKSITPDSSLYSFSFDPQEGENLEFILAGEACSTFFSLLDEMMTPNTPSPPTTPLATADSDGNPKGELEVTLARVKTFIDKISLFNYSFALDGNPAFDFMLTSTDAGGFFGNLDSVLWSNPPNPPH
jgi:hypothetical protein